MRLLFLFLWLTGMKHAAAQTATDYPQHDFRNPLGIPITLAGGFAECRPNHFHTGIDLKTNQQENLPVYAAAEGYISRIAISHTGYGNAIYINHPNGYTTVYGHLNDFYPSLQAYLEQQQYALERWNLDLSLTPGQFPVAQGQQVAWSGTTGGSTGPHLHFEIRNTTTERVLNALLFGLPFRDTKAPVAKSLAIYGATQSIYEQDPDLLQLSPSGNSYSLAGTYYSPHPSIRIGIEAQDYTNNSNNWLGIYEMKLFMDEVLQASTLLREIDFAQNRYVNAYADFKTKEDKGVWYQGLYRLPNNILDAYPFLNSNRGSLDISDGQPHVLRIELKDPAGNAATVHGTVQYKPTGQPEEGCPAGATLWSWNIRNELQTGTVSLIMDKHTLYDDICFRYTETPSAQQLSSVVQLHDTRVPMQEYASLALKINQPIPFAWRTKLVFVHHIKAASLPGNNPQQGMAAQYDKGWAKAAIRTFGNFYVSIDTIGPNIRPLQKTEHLSAAESIRFSVTDNLSSVKSFRAELDGKWLRFIRSGNTYTYYFDDRCPKGKHSLLLTASDENDNFSTYTLSFTR